jgi:lipoprotein-anchoring transpeptidase ErfK/SrfK
MLAFGRQVSVQFALALAVACAREEPPGAGLGPSPVRVSAGQNLPANPAAAVGPLGAANGADNGANDTPGQGAPAAAAEGTSEAVEGLPAGEALGSVSDNLPFTADGKKIASIAWRTWIYTDTGPQRTRYGNLRAGAIVDRRDPAIVNSGCEGGWYRVNPRGFVCVGKGATLDLNHPVVVASQKRPIRGAGLPYVYALSDQRAPHLYFKLPSRSDMREVEGDYEGNAARWFEARRARQQMDLLAYEGEPPPFLHSGALTKPYGSKQGLRYQVHAGQASSDSGFAVSSSFPWEGRVFGLTTELDLIALDRTRVVEPSRMQGVVLTEDEDLPVAIVTDGAIPSYEVTESGALKKSGAFEKRTVLKIASEKQRVGGVGYWQTREGLLIPAAGVDVIEKRTSFPSVATGTRKWIDVSLKRQTLVAYVGTRAVFATLVSTGAGGLGDPEKVPATVQGTFMIYAKHVTETMDGDEDKGDSFNLHDVPFVQYFHKGFALHGTYWHDDFGRWRSHGCVNLAPKDAAWLFEWTDPPVPNDWHSVINKERGTVVHIHP